jgi:hypothetical protein
VLANANANNNNNNQADQQQALNGAGALVPQQIIGPNGGPQLVLMQNGGMYRVVNVVPVVPFQAAVPNAPANPQQAERLSFGSSSSTRESASVRDAHPAETSATASPSIPAMPAASTVHSAQLESGTTSAIHAAAPAVPVAFTDEVPHDTLDAFPNPLPFQRQYSDLDFAELSSEQLRTLEGFERDNIICRIRFLQGIQDKVSHIITELTQYLSVVDTNQSHNVAMVTQSVRSTQEAGPSSLTTTDISGNTEMKGNGKSPQK